jgi:hypothetical protein
MIIGLAASFSVGTPVTIRKTDRDRNVLSGTGGATLTHQAHLAWSPSPTVRRGAEEELWGPYSPDEAAILSTLAAVRD